MVFSGCDITSTLGRQLMVCVYCGPSNGASADINFSLTVGLKVKKALSRKEASSSTGRA